MVDRDRAFSGRIRGGGSVRKNIVLVTYDSLRADHCGFMGYKRNTTPNLDRIANDAVVFENAVASGVPTIASMTAVMTGEHSAASPEIGFDGQQREEVTSRPTIAEILSKAGYSTGALSPNPPASSYFGFDEGFDWFEDYLAADRGLIDRSWNRIFERSIRGGELSTYVRLFRNVLKREEILRPWEAYYDDILRWCQQAEQPYFLWVLLLDPHHPWLPPTEYQEWSSRFDKYRAFKHYWEMLNSGWEPDFDDTVRERLLNLYDDSIRYADAFLGRLQDDLEGDDPVFVVHADHGEEFGRHGRYGHQPVLYEDLIHVPLVIDGIDRSDRISDPVGLRQIAPTVCEIAGVSHPYSTPGLFDSDGPAWVESQVVVNGTQRISIRTERAKYLRDRRSDRRELFDLALDPHEQENLVESTSEGSEVFETCVKRHEQVETEKQHIRQGVRELRPADTGGDVR